MIWYVVTVRVICSILVARISTYPRFHIWCYFQGCLPNMRAEMRSILALYLISTRMLTVWYYVWCCVMSVEDILIQNCACSNNFKNASVKGIWLCCSFLCVLSYVYMFEVSIQASPVLFIPFLFHVQCLACLVASLGVNTVPEFNISVILLLSALELCLCL
jgi:hypothetical protein